MNTDISSLYRPHSPSLPQRRHVYKANNQVKGNRPVEIGYELSTIGLSSRQPLYGMSEPAWNPPLSMRLVPYGENKNNFTARQVNDLIDNKDLPFHKSLTVNALDSSYCSPEYVVGTYCQKNLLNIIRSPSNRNVYKQLSEQEVKQRRINNKDNRGANSVYGAKYKLKEVEDWDLSCDRQISFGVKLAKVSPSQVQLQMTRIILGFEQTPFLPKLQINGKGRQLGQTQLKREQYPVLTKSKKRKRQKKRYV